MSNIFPVENHFCNSKRLFAGQLSAITGCSLSKTQAFITHHLNLNWAEIKHMLQVASLDAIL